MGTQTRPRHVLVVEDDLATREEIALLLRHTGYEVSQAANGREALQRLRDGGKPCVILLDLQMPVLDGWQFGRELRRHAELADIPVVVVSAARFPRAAADLRAAEYIQKPVEVGRLLEAVRRHC